MTSTTEEFPGGYPTTPPQEKKESVVAPWQDKNEESDTSRQEKNEGNKETFSDSLLQYSKDLVSTVSSVMPGTEKAEGNKGSAPQTREKNEESDISRQEKNKESDTSRQEKNEGNETFSDSLLQYSKGLVSTVSSVMPGTEKAEGKNEGDKKLEFQPNPSMKPTDDNHITKLTNKGSSAMGGITNPVGLLSGDAEREGAAKGEVDASHTIKPHNVAASNQKGQKSSDVVLPNAVLPESRLPKDDQHQQKEKEQEQDKRDHKLSGKHQKQESEGKSFGDKVTPHLPPVKILTGNTDRSGKGDPAKPNSAVHPEDQDSVPKVTKKDKVNATVSKAVGTLKEKIGRLVKNDNLAARGAEEKAEGKKTKELAEVQKQVDEI